MKFVPFVIFFYFCFCFAHGKKLMPTELISVEKCNLGDNALYEENVHFDIIPRLVKKRLIFSAQLQLDRKVGPVWLNLTLIACATNETKMNYERIDCRYPPMRIVYGAMKLRITKECALEPGTYALKDFNINSFSKYFFVNMKGMGRLQYKTHFYTQQGTFACIEAILG